MHLRSTMGQQKPNNILVLHTHKDKADKLSMLDVTNKFVCSEHRLSILENSLTTDCCQDNISLLAILLFCKYIAI